MVKLLGFGAPYLSSCYTPHCRVLLPIIICFVNHQKWPLSTIDHYQSSMNHDWSWFTSIFPDELSWSIINRAQAMITWWTPASNPLDSPSNVSMERLRSAKATDKFQQLWSVRKELCGNPPSLWPLIMRLIIFSSWLIRTYGSQDLWWMMVRSWLGHCWPWFVHK